ncbi:MAG: hypothetical protein CME06_03650 [Gemmatimonadetes bacterium]|nr:hypothetical protein [Gemmatimonadota bacterium]
MALQLGVTLSRQGILTRTLVLFLYPVAFACVGLGAAAGQAWLPRLRASAPSRAAGLALLAFFAVSLRAHFMTVDPGELRVAATAHLITLSAWFVCIGLALGPLLRQAHRAGPRWVGRGWAVHLLGLVVGYLGFDLLVAPAGANVIVVATSLSLLLLPRLGIVVLAGVLWAAPPLDLDWQLERLRRTEQDLGKRYDFLAPRLGSRGRAISSRFQPLYDQLETPLFHGWSRLSQLRFVDAGAVGAGIGAFYNYHFMWLTGPESLRGPKDDLRERIYALLPPEGRALVIGAGGGRGLYSFPFAPHAGITAVEIDPTVVRVLRDRHPEWNGGLFKRVNAVAADGRTVAEQHPGDLDAILIESARWVGTQGFSAAVRPRYLYTQEAIATYLERLTDTGFLLIGLANVVTRPHRYLPAQIVLSLKELGAPHWTFHDPGTGHVQILACRDAEALDEKIEALGLEVERPFLDHAPRTRYRLRDDTPFFSWGILEAGVRGQLVRMAAGLVAGCIAGLVVLRRRVTPGPAWNPIIFFFAIGVAHTCMQLATVHAYRGFFVDQVHTMVRLVIYFLVYGAIGSALAHRLPPRALAVLPRVAGTVLVLALHLAALAWIPFAEARWWIRELFPALTLFPAGVLMGIFFPLGLAAARHELVGSSLLADALGALAAMALIFFTLIPFGQTAFALCALIAYGAAAVLLRPAPAGTPVAS